MCAGGFGDAEEMAYEKGSSMMLSVRTSVCPCKEVFENMAIRVQGNRVSAWAATETTNTIKGVSRRRRFTLHGSVYPFSSETILAINLTNHHGWQFGSAKFKHK